MKPMTQAAILIQALTSGEILYKKVDDENGEYFFMNTTHKFFEQKGWGSAIGDECDRIREIVAYPERWVITDYTLEDTPWSTLLKPVI